MTYEYICTACAHAWEEEQPISAAPTRVCPNCKAETAKRQVSGGAGFILRGGGWYADLYGSAKPGKKDDAGSSSTKSTESSTASSESKTTTSETKTETKAQPAAAATKPAATGS